MSAVRITYSLRILFAVFTTVLPTFVFGNTVTDTTQAMTVFGDIYIGKEASISVMGDVILKADIMGEGILQLNGVSQQKITSENVHVDNLEIKNKSNVLLEGKLTVNKKFSLEEGDFIISKGAKLAFESTCQKVINHNSKIINLNRVQLYSSDWSSSSNSQNNFSSFVTISTTTDNNIYREGLNPTSPISKSINYSFLAYQKLKQPPK